jgi:hypothetical protein
MGELGQENISTNGNNKAVSTNVQPFALPNKHEDAGSRWMYLHAVSDAGHINRTGPGRVRSTVVKAEVHMYKADG